MKLRIRHPPDNPVLEIPDTQTFGFLRDRISSIVGLSPAVFTIKSGFPPLEVLAGDSASLLEAKLSDGDLLTIQPAMSQPGMSGTSHATTKRVRDVATSTTAEDHSVEVTGTDPSSSSFEPAAKKLRTCNVDAVLGHSEEEWGMNLVELFSKSGGSLNASQRLLKGAFRNAVRRSAESALAEHRCTAGQCGSYELQETTGSVKFKVTFKVGRTKRTEQYVAFPRELLAAVIKEVYNSGIDSQTGVDARNNLRPIYLAEAQPSCGGMDHCSGSSEWMNCRRCKTWSFTNQECQQGCPCHTTQGLRSLCPGIDWDFIDSRERPLSEKAKLSKEQEKKRRRPIGAKWKATGNAEAVNEKQEESGTVKEKVEEPVDEKKGEPTE